MKILNTSKPVKKKPFEVGYPLWSTMLQASKEISVNGVKFKKVREGVVRIVYEQNGLVHSTIVSRLKDYVDIVEKIIARDKVELFKRGDYETRT